MNERTIKAAVVLSIGTLIVINGIVKTRATVKVEREKRKAILNEMGLDVAAIHNATDVVNSRIEKGEIRSWDQLREAVTTEVAFQKITIREDPNQ